LADNNINNSWADAPPTPDELKEPATAAASDNSWADTPPTAAELSAPAADNSWADTPPTAAELSQPAVRTPNPREDYLTQTNQVTKDELAEIAKRHGADPDQLASIAPYLGVGVESEPGAEEFKPGQTLKKIAGTIGRTAFNLPQLEYKKLQDPGTRAAIDDLQDLANERKSTGLKVASAVTEFALGGLAIAGMGAVAAPAAAAGAAGAAGAGFWSVVGRTALEGAVFGAAGGLGNSKEGQEMAGIEHGALLGGALGAGLGVGGKTLSKMSDWIGSRAEADSQEVMRRVDQELARPEVQEAVEAGDRHIQGVATGEPPAALPDRALIDSASEHLQSDDASLAESWQANPDLDIERETAGWSDEEYIRKLAERDVYAEQASDTAQFADYLDSRGDKVVIRDADDLAKATPAETLEKAQQTIKDWVAEGRTAADLSAEYKSFKVSQIAAEMNADYVARGGGVLSSAASRLGRRFLRAPGQLRAIDNRAGTVLEPLAYKASTTRNLMNREVANIMRATADVRSAINASGLRTLDAEALSRIEAGDLSALSKDQVSALDGFSKTMETLRLRAGELGSPIEAVAAEKAAIYIPRKQVDTATTMARIGTAASDVEQATGISMTKGLLTDSQLAEAQLRAPKEMNKLREGLEWVSGESPQNAQDMQRLTRQATDAAGIVELRSARINRETSSAAKQRAESGVPDWLRETDLNKLQVRWLTDVFRDAYYKPVVRDLVTQRNLLAAVNDKAGQEYVQQFISTLQGGKRDIPGWVARQKSGLVASCIQKEAAARAAGNTGQANFYRFFAENSDLPGLLGTSMYSNLLGLNPHTLIMNMVQPWMTTLPELSSGGFGWGSSKLMAGYFKTLGELATPGVKAFRLLEERGYMPPHMSSELVDAFRTGVERSWPAKAARSAIQGWMKGSMALLQMSESMNRVVAANAADSIAKDLVAGSPSANAFLARMGRGAAYDIERSIAAGNVGTVTEKVADYLVGKTMFHYDPAMMSQMGKYLGRIGGAMTTWPSSVAADIVADFSRGGLKGGTLDLARKYLGTMAAMSVLQTIASSRGMDPATSPRAKALLGSRGLTSMAPLSSVLDVASRGSPIQTPFTELMFKDFASLATGGPEEWWQTMNRVAGNFVPFAGLVKLLDTTLPAIVSNAEGPEKGSTLFGRTARLAGSSQGTSLDEYIKAKYGR